MIKKAHFILAHGIEGYEETSEPQRVFGQFVGFNVYLFIDFSLLQSVKLIGEYISINVKQNNHLPEYFTICTDAIVEVKFDKYGFLVCLKGGHSITKKIIHLEFN